MMDSHKPPQQQQQQTLSSSPCWQQIADALHDYRLMVDGAKDGLWIYNVSSDRYVVSEKDRQRFDFEPAQEAYSLATWQDLLHPDDAVQAVGAFVDFLEGSSDIYENTYRLRSRDGLYRWVKSHGIADRAADGTVVSGQAAIRTLPARWSRRGCCTALPITMNLPSCRIAPSCGETSTPEARWHGVSICRRR